jgi:cold shock CspA family protein
MAQVPLQISFRDIDPSDFIESRIAEKAAVLERFSDDIISCRVVVEAPHRHGHKGTLYNIRVNVHVPGDQIVVDHEHRQDHAHEDVYVAIRDAFEAAVRRLEDYERKRRGQVKTHEAPTHGKVLRTFDAYGFVQTSDGREIYFHKNSVAEGDFADLKEGDEVRLVIAYDESPEGPQASTVVPLGKHHIVP